MILVLWESAAAQHHNLSFENISIKDGLSQVSIYSIMQDSKGFMWFGTFDGLNKYDGYNFTVFSTDPNNPNSLSNDIIQSIYEDRSDILWIGTDGGGLNKFDQEKGQFIHYRHDPNDSNSLSDDKVFSIYEDRSGILWIGTEGGGLNKFDQEKGQFIYYTHDPNNPMSLSNDKVFSIYEDRSGILWIGTNGGGLNKFDREKEQFTRYQHDPNNPMSLSNDNVFSIYEERPGILWIGTNGGGLNIFDREKEQFSHNKHDSSNPKSLNNDHVQSIYEDRSGILWIGTWGGGISKFDRYKEQFGHYKHDPNSSNSLSSNIVISIYEDRSGILWIGTRGGGLDKFDQEKDQFTRYMHDPNDPYSLSNNNVFSIFEDRSGILWIGTHAGLNKFDREKEQFIYYRKKDGLPNDVIYGIKEDNKNNIWVSTNKGISKFNPKTGKFKNFDVNDGLQSNEFNGGAHFQSEDGRIFFGGVNGFNVFHPDSLRSNTYIPPVVITDFQIFNKTVAIQSDGSVEGIPSLSRHISVTNEILLSYQESVFSFEFSALDYSVPGKNQYAYMMEGFDKDWFYTDADRRIATYTNLDAGEYIFKVKASNNNGIWNEEGHSIKIIITPPYWQTWWFRLLTVITIIALVITAHRYRTKEIEASNKRLKNEISERKEAEQLLALRAEELEESNANLEQFTRAVSHDLKAPLRAIHNYADWIREDLENLLKDGQHEYLDGLGRAVNQSEVLIEDLLELSRIGRTRNISELISLTEFFNQLVESFDLDNNVDIDIQEDLPTVVCEKLLLRQVFQNLILNGIKFNEQKTKRVNITCTPNSLTHFNIAVSDNGIGIDSKYHDQIFNVFQRLHTVDEFEGTGIGLAIVKKALHGLGGKIEVQSEPGIRSTFTVILPINNKKE